MITIVPAPAPSDPRPPPARVVARHRAGIRRLPPSIAIAASPTSPKSGVSRLRSDNYNPAKTIGDVVRLSGAEGWRNPTYDWRKGYVTTDESALRDLMPRPVNVVLTYMPEIVLYGIFDPPVVMPISGLHDLTIPSDNLSYTEQYELVKTAMHDDSLYNTYNDHRKTIVVLPELALQAYGSQLATVPGNARINLVSETSNANVPTSILLTAAIPTLTSELLRGHCARVQPRDTARSTSYSPTIAPGCPVKTPVATTSRSLNEIHPAFLHALHPYYTAETTTWSASTTSESPAAYSNNYQTTPSSRTIQVHSDTSNCEMPELERYPYPVNEHNALNATELPTYVNPMAYDNQFDTPGEHMSTVSRGLTTNASSVFFIYHRLPPRIESVVSRGYLDNISKKAARGDSNFMTPSTVTSPVFYFHEFNKLSTNEHTTSSFHLQISWTMTIFVVAAYVLMITASCILLPTTVRSSYTSTQWSKATISGASKDNISKKSRHEAIRLAIIRQATKDWIIAPTYRNTANMDADVLTKPLSLANLLYFYPRVYGKL